MVSTLLVSIYLAHLEATHLPVLSDELLIRMMDDYLFLTPHRPRAQHFLEVMKKGDDKCIMCVITVSSVLEKERGGGGGSVNMC